MKKLLAGVLALLMTCSAALAEARSYAGEVVSTQTAALLAPAAGVIGEVLYQAGQRVRAGDEVAGLQGTTVYAEEPGTVQVFGAEGDAVETLVSRYGAVLYLEPDCALTLTGNTAYAYDAAENRNIHPGEIVYLKSTAPAGHEGTGLVTVVSGTKYTVEVLEGNLADEDIVYIYRSSDGAVKRRIGRGTVGYTGATAMFGSGTGVISEMLVKTGDHVDAGTPLYTVVDAAAFSWRMTSPVKGVVASVSVAPGDPVEAGTLIALFSPDDALRLALMVESRELRSIRVGDTALVTFDNGVEAQGVVKAISGVPFTPEEDDDTVYFAVYVTFDTAESIPVGMTGYAVIGE